MKIITLDAEDKNYIKNVIDKDVIIRRSSGTEKIFNSYGEEMRWFCDFRRAFSQKKFLETVAHAFWNNFDRDYPWQIGGLESASLPLITALVLSSTDSSGFFIRKSRKKKGQSRLIEGKLNANKIILVDDLLNTGRSFEKQIKALEDDDIEIAAIFTIMHFFDESRYDYLNERSIPIYSMFDLNEFDVERQRAEQETLMYKTEWYFGPKYPNLLVQGSRCLPCIEDNRMYTVSDSGHVWVLDTQSGAAILEKKLQKDIHPAKSTFTNVVLGEKNLVVGTHNGKLLTLSKTNLSKVSEEYVGDHITTPLYKIDSRIIFGNRTSCSSFTYSVVCFDVEMQTIVWQQILPARIYNILIDSQNQRIFLAARNGRVICLSALDGVQMWEYSVKERVLVQPIFLNEDRSEILIVSEMGSMYKFSSEGKLLAVKECETGVKSVPLLHSGHVYMSSLEREIHAYEAKTFKEIWKRKLDGRTYASPVIHDDKLYIGDNRGTLSVFEPHTGKRIGHMVVSERINNPVIVHNKTLIVTTSANEVYCLSEHPKVE